MFGAKLKSQIDKEIKDTALMSSFGRSVDYYTKKLTILTTVSDKVGVTDTSLINARTPLTAFQRTSYTWTSEGNATEDSRRRNVKTKI